MQKIVASKELVIDSLDYHTLKNIFDGAYCFDTDKIILKTKRFTEGEVEQALRKHTSDLQLIFSEEDNSELYEDGMGVQIDDRGKIIDLLMDMLDDDYDKIDKQSLAIEETIHCIQWHIEGLDNHTTARFGKSNRYFNPDPEVEIVLI